jgi:hypothetical protein
MAPLIQIKHPTLRGRTLLFVSTEHFPPGRRAIELIEQLHLQANETSTGSAYRSARHQRRELVHELLPRIQASFLPPKTLVLCGYWRGPRKAL